MNDEKLESFTRNKKFSIKTSMTHVSAFTSVLSFKSRIKENLILVSSIIYSITLITSIVFSLYICKNLIIFNLNKEDDYQIDEFRINSIFLYTIIILIIVINIFFQFSFIKNYSNETFKMTVSNNVGKEYVVALCLLSISSLLSNVWKFEHSKILLINSISNTLSICKSLI